jgi:regulation of enolase protein 1 (concanavalin A-like superfamily)
VTSHNARAATTAVISNVSITRSAVQATDLSSADLGKPALAGSTTSDAAKGTWQVRAGGADFWGSSDQGRFLSRTVVGDAQLTVHVSSLAMTDVWAKAGLMMRSSLNANASHVSVFVTPSNGIVLQWRSSNGGTSYTSHSFAGAAPRWLRLMRDGNTFYAFCSVDGSTWDLVDFVTVTLPQSVAAGLAVTSHNTGALTTANFDSFSVD